ncbi:18273_t:CDS:1, partial [Racocetra fulgida]
TICERERKRFDRKSFVVLDDNVESDNWDEVVVSIDELEESDQSRITEDRAYGDIIIMLPEPIYN